MAVATNLAAYPPAHLFARSQREPTLNIAIGAITTVAVVAMMLWRRRTGIVNWLGWTAACLAVLHAFIGLGELEGTHFDYCIWEGANYLFIGAVLVVAAVLAERAGSIAGRRTARRPAPKAIVWMPLLRRSKSRSSAGARSSVIAAPQPPYTDA